MEPRVIYEDNHLLIINKLTGWLVQGDKTGDRTLTDWGREYIKSKYNKPGAVFLHPCHRLDRPVSGIVIFARTSKALERVNKIFKQDLIEKTYLAVVGQKPPKDSEELIHWLVKDGKKNITRSYKNEVPNSKKAILTYKYLTSSGDYSLLKVTPKTGRPHQIRVQLQSMNCPIKGDLKYGFPKSNEDKSISLHAFKVKFEHPVKKEEMVITSRPNWTEFKELIDELD